MQAKKGALISSRTIYLTLQGTKILEELNGLKNYIFTNSGKKISANIHLALPPPFFSMV